MKDLIERLEKATGPDRALDCKIWLALYDKQIMVDGGGYSPNARPPKYESARKIWGDDWPHWGNRTQVEHGVAIEIDAPRYTASIDAALTLVPDGYASAVGTMAFKNTNKLPWACYWTPQGSPHSVDGVTPAIALCIAALKVRAALTEAKT